MIPKFWLAIGLEILLVFNIGTTGTNTNLSYKLQLTQNVIVLVWPWIAEPKLAEGNQK